MEKKTFKVVAGGTQYFIEAKVTMLGDSCVLAGSNFDKNNFFEQKSFCINSL